MSDDISGELIDDLLNTLWLRWYVGADTLCTLCGNTGRIDTTATARSPAGVMAGRVNFCICPNGRSMRAHSGRPSLPKPKRPR